MGKHRLFEEWAKDFKEYNQNGKVPMTFKTPEGHNLGYWCYRVRRKGKKAFTKAQVKLLDEYGFVWSVKKVNKKPRRTFDEWFQDFILYSENGYVPSDFKTPNGNNLSSWITRIRSGQLKTTEEQKKRLTEAGFVWKIKRVRRSFEEWFADFVLYQKNGTVKRDFVTPEGYTLGVWVAAVRCGHTKLTQEQIKQLNSYGFRWQIKKRSKYRNFEEWFHDFVKYNQDGYVPYKFVTPEGDHLGRWFQAIRVGKIKITAEQRKRLNRYHFEWEHRKVRRTFDEWLQDFILYNKNGNVTYTFVTPEGHRLGNWVANVRIKKFQLTEEQIAVLNQHHFVWRIQIVERSFEEWFNDYLLYHDHGKVHKSFKTPEGYSLGLWVENIRYGKTKITEAQRELLTQNEFRWKKPKVA